MLNLCFFVFLAGCRPGSTLRTMRNSAATALIIVLTWFILPEEQQNRVRSIWDDDVNVSATASAEGRIEGFKAGLAMFRNFPILGVGPGCFIPYRIRYLDGANLVAHNLPGQMLGETGLVGTVAFVFLVAAPLANRRRLREMASECPDMTVQMLADLGRACRDVIILLFVDGLAGDALYRYNWLWLGAFCSLAMGFASAIHQSHLSVGANCQESSNPMEETPLTN
jgi:hypothetical protein